MLRDPDRNVMEQAYARWAPIYDAVCGPVFLNGRRAAASAAREVGGRILEIGVGTGLSFDDYDATTEIVGIDISEPMIARARERLQSGRYPFVKELAVMDAHELAYQDASLRLRGRPIRDHAGGGPGTRALGMRAACCGPGGQIILVNHLYSERGLDCRRRDVLLAQKARKVGLRAGISLSATGSLGSSARRSGTHRAAQGSNHSCVYTLVRFRRAVPRHGARPQ